MKEISARQLAFILKEKEDDSNRRIINILQKNGVAKEELYQKEVCGNSYAWYPKKGRSIDISLFEKETGIEISVAIDSIKKNYLKNTATRAYIMDLPDKKLVPGKTGLYPPKVSIPTVLRTLLTSAQINEIIEKWNEIYKEHPAIKDFGVVFK